MREKIKLSDHFTYRKLLKFTLPSISMMIFTSFYGMVDGFFVSNFAGKTPFAAVNFIMPLLIIMGAVGFMLGTGGSALVSKILGEGDEVRAREAFSLITYFAIISGVILSAIGIAAVRPIAELLGARGDMLEYCVVYGRIILVALPCFMLQQLFQSFLVAAEKPGLGFAFSVAAGCTNIVLDLLFVGVAGWGIEGAAIATAISQGIGGIAPIIYFTAGRSSALYLTGCKISPMTVWRASLNGSSELLSNISVSFVGILYNAQLLKYAGDDGVAAYGVLMYSGFLLVSTFIGYSIGSSPIVSYNFGAGRIYELKNVRKKSLIITAVISVFMFAVAEIFARPFSLLFVGYDEELLNLTVDGFLIYAFSFLFCGFGIFSSGFFTALNNGPVSAVISLFRTVVFQCICVIILPLLFGIHGIFLSLTVSEALSALLGGGLLIAFRKRYGY